MDKCGVPYSRSFYKINKRRINNTEYKNEEFVKCKRKKERSLKNKQADTFVRDEGIQYKSGQFYSSEK